ncbi:recombinase family protein [Pedobacter fastidiosus]|uniref:Recombinase family protein n=1 Tax=Pedobacter fastidiosus TaxID=2765361 RepID=A0ABR7KQN1_9SPHI|nr:recombinase family protein [Pedobacter fastidiosus]MBC6110308.1 recombinase family protein [Pedobacter fastidiosus]
MKTAVLYIRVSTDEQAEKGYSLNHQKEVLEKYCEINKIAVKRIFTEDFSAKSFNRPEWKKLIDFLKKNKEESTLILFTRWDRFSRNIGEAYQTIASLKKINIESKAIEQPLNLDVPENKLMLAIYLAIPEIENDRKGLSTKAGIRQARKEGRVTGRAPLGYKNRTDEDGNKYIIKKEPEASIIKWIFDQIERNIFSSENIWQIACEKGLICSRNNFHYLLKNPLYYGKVVVLKNQNEDAYLIQSKHQPIIKEDQFKNVQNILSTRLKRKGLCIFAPDNFILRGFLHCPRCGLKLTSSTRRDGRLPRYFYHCHSACRYRIRAEAINNKFIEEINACCINQGVVRSFIKTMINAHKNQLEPISKKNKKLSLEIHALNKKINRARDLQYQEQINKEEYDSISYPYLKKLEFLEKEVQELNSELISWRSLKAISKSALRSLGNLQSLFYSSNPGGKRKLISSIIGESVIFDGKKFQLNQFNKVYNLIQEINLKLTDRDKCLDINNVKPDNNSFTLDNIFISQLREVADLESTVPEFDRYGEKIKNILISGKIMQMTDLKKTRIRKKRIARKIVLKRWIIETLR